MRQQSHFTRQSLAVLTALTLPVCGFAKPDAEPATKPLGGAPEVEQVASSESLLIGDAVRSRFPRLSDLLGQISSIQGVEGLSRDDVNTFTAMMRVFIDADIKGRDLTQEENARILGLTEPQFNQYLVDHGLVLFNEYEQRTPDRFVLGPCFGLFEVAPTAAEIGAKGVMQDVKALMESRGFICPSVATEVSCLAITSSLIARENAVGRRLGTCLELDGTFAIVLSPEHVEALQQYLPEGQRAGVWAGVIANEFFHVRNHLLFPGQDERAGRSFTVGAEKIEGTWMELNEASSDLGSLLVTRPDWSETLALSVTQALTGRGGAYRLSDMIVAHVTKRLLGEEYALLQRASNATDFSDPEQFERLLERCAMAVREYPQFRKELISEYVRSLEQLKDQI